MSLHNVYKKPYQLIYADPPWKFKNKNTGGNMGSGSANQYPVMKIDDICNLPINEIAAEDCLLAMWWVGSMPKEAIKAAEAWGFTLKTMTGLDWVKLTKKGKLWFGMGFYSRQGIENVLFATKGHPKVDSRSIRAVIKHVIGVHSEKPAIFRDTLVRLMGDVPRIELFARKEFLGWDAIGTQVDGLDIREVLSKGGE